jgi:endonuclease/exonuclease/phosphatase family metal-dependent hydrolase
MLRKNDRPFFVYNAHLDHKGSNARVKGAEALLDRVKADREIYELPIFIMGDFNDFPDSKCISVYNEFSSPKLTNLTDNIETTFHSFGNLRENSKIDYIFADEKTAPFCTKGVIWNENVNGIYLSDHYPVSIVWNID